MFSLYYRQPREVSIETLALCNARCTFCPYPTLERIGTRLETPFIYGLLNQMRDWSKPFFIAPFKVNEPLLDERLKDICEYVDREIPMAQLRLFTNGSPLTTRHIEWIANLRRVAHLWVSLNESNDEDYFRVMGLRFSATVSRLEILHEKICSRRFRHSVIVSRVTDAMNAGEPTQKDNAFIKFVESRWPMFSSVIIKRDAWIDYTTPAVQAVPARNCARWFELNIMATGKVSLCCMDGTGEYGIGDTRESTLLDIYNQPHLLERRMHVSRRDGIEPCGRCTY